MNLGGKRFGVKGHNSAHNRRSAVNHGKIMEKEMTTHSSTLAWKIPWMEEPGRLQSMGSQRAGHD